MKKIFFLTLSLLLMTSCKNEKKQNKIVKEEANTSDSIVQRTYAEIWIKKGGTWENQKYIGGKFEQVKEVEIPINHTDHSGFIKYEGPGWENKNVAYRLYLDWRNAIDIFGKKVDTMVLPEVGQAGLDSYHKEAPWGLDILKAGRSLGIGGFGRFMNDTVAHFSNVQKTLAEVENDEDKSSVIIHYSGWKTGTSVIDLKATLQIYPQDIYTKVELKPSKKIEGLTTGIVKKENIPMIQNDTTGSKWAYIATYGEQTLVDENDKLGLAIFYRKNQLEKIVDAENDYLVVFKPGTETISYYFLGAWEQQKNGITSKKEFDNYLQRTLFDLETGIK